VTLFRETQEIYQRELCMPSCVRSGSSAMTSMPHSQLSRFSAEDQSVVRRLRENYNSFEGIHAARGHSAHVR
jgi:hypothetical protein